MCSRTLVASKRCRLPVAATAIRLLCMAGFQITNRAQCRASCKGCSLGGGRSGAAPTLPSILKTAQVLPAVTVAIRACCRSCSGPYRPSACFGMMHERSRSNLLDMFDIDYQYPVGAFDSQPSANCFCIELGYCTSHLCSSLCQHNTAHDAQQPVQPSIHIRHWLDAGASLHIRAVAPSILNRQEPPTPTTSTPSRVHWDVTPAAQDGAEQQMRSPFQGQQPPEDHQSGHGDTQSNRRLFPDTPEGHMATVCMHCLACRFCTSSWRVMTVRPPSSADLLSMQRD